MIFKLHYWFLAAGANALGILLGVFLANYTQASSTQIGLVYLLMPFSSMIFRPIICSLADRAQAHQKYLINLLLITAVGYLPFILVPLAGPRLYLDYPTFCWYFFLSFKIVGDIAFSSVVSIADSLAINYAHRLGTDYSVYRRWATYSWMTFGFILGQVNEIWFLPKYVPAFMILILFSLLDAFVIWLWPPEYFVMVPLNDSLKKKHKSATETIAKVSSEPKVLMPRAVVWAHMKMKLYHLVTLSCFSPSNGKSEDKETAMVAITSNQSRHQSKDEGEKMGGKKLATIDKRTQLGVLLLLLKRDPRILFYALMFVAGGASVMPLSFFFMSLPEVCERTQQCDFSQLGGLIQISVGTSELFMFMVIHWLMAKIGRLNTASIAFALACLKYSFYGTIWPSVHPYFALVAEIPHGFIFGTFLVLMVELANFFANEVEFLLPELIERGVVEADDQAGCDRLKMSLAATMQALMSSANDGFGRGVGALIYGSLLDHYSFITLWRIIATGTALVVVALQAVNMFDRCLGLNLGLDNKFEREAQLQETNAANLARVKEKGLNLSDNLDTISIRSKGAAGNKMSADIKLQQAA